MVFRTTHRIKMTTPGADIKVFPWITEAPLILLRSKMQRTIHKEESEEKAPRERRNF